MEGVNSKVLLYNTENYIQYLMINYNGKEYLFYYLKISFGHAIFILLLLLNFFWLFCVAGGILVPLPGIEPMSPVAEVES